MTEELFRSDAYLRSTRARITAIDDLSVTLDRTVFYPMGGGQPGDRGTLTASSGAVIEVVDTRKGEAPGAISHIAAQPVDPALLGETVVAEIDWQRRHRLMRVHTMLHVLGSVVHAGVTGGAIRDDGSGRLDFDLPESTLDKEHIAREVNRIIADDHAVSARWVSEDELDSNPDLVRTMSVTPPRGQGQVRLLEIAGIDLQACGGTHVARTGEIGEALVGKIEKKGKHNRRVSIRLAEP